MTRRLVLASSVLVLALTALLPLVVMLARSFMVHGAWSLEYYTELASSWRSWALLKNSLVLGISTSAIALLAGVPLGILLSKTDLPGRRVFAVLFSVPLLLPPYVTAVAWFEVLGRQGLISYAVGTGVAEHTSALLFGFAGCLLVLFSAFVPIIFLLTMALSRSVNPRLEEGGRLVASWATVLRGITIPLILPGLGLAATLVFLLAIGELGVPMFLRYDVFPVESFMRFSAFFDFGAATAAAVPLAILSLVLLAGEWVVFRNTARPLQSGPTGETIPQIYLGRVRVPLFCCVSVLCAFLIALPIFALLLRSGSLAAYREAWTRAGDSLLRSLLYAGIGATLLTAVGFLLGYLIHTRAFRWWRVVDMFTLFSFALPGTVLGIGLVSLWNRPETTIIYGTPLILLLGYLAQYVALPSRITVAVLSQIPSSMEEAAQVSGAGWVSRVSRIVVPLSGRGLLAAWVLAFIFCLRDLSVAMVVYPPGRDVFTVRTFTLMANPSIGLIPALCVILILATLLPLGGLALLLRLGGPWHPSNLRQ